MRVSVITADASGNTLGRAYILAKVLQQRFDVEIAGPCLGEGVWEPLSGMDIPLKTTAVGRSPFGYARHLMGLLGRLSGDVIYAQRPLATSFGLGLLKRALSRRPLILDMDDWELSFYKPMRLQSKVKNLLLNSNSYWSTKLLERLVKKADAVTVTNPFLQAKFGGIIVPNGRDTDALDPAKFDGHAMRRQLGLESARVVLFLGSPRKHKGIEDLIEAVRLAGTPDLKLLLVGLGADPYSERLRRLAQDSLGPQAILVGQQPWSRVPEFLAASDVVAIPQIETEVTSWQVPMKVFDAMAMGRPVVATRTSGLPEALEGCGWLVEPGKPGELAEAIDHVLTHPEEARLRGMEARERCIKGFSYSSMAGTLMPLVEGLLEKKRLKARAAARHEV